MNDLSADSVDVSHHVQRGILLQLRQHGAQSYGELKPDGLEGNAYNYHLAALRRAKLISLDNHRYQLTSVGQVVADSFSYQAKRMMLRPYVYTFLLVVADGHILLYEPSRQPFPGILCLPSGKIHYGDSFEQSVAREATRRSLSADYRTELISSINLIYRRDDDIVMQRPGMIWHLDYTGVRHDSSTPSGSAHWHRLDELAAIERLAPEVTAAVELLDSPRRRVVEIDVAL